jgi:GT2 family glycosyltransferase
MAAPMPTQAVTRLSIVVVTHNSGNAVAVSLPALCGQLRVGDELIVVDNGSTDDTVRRVGELAPAARVICSHANLGFAAGANAGARAASGELLLFLNPDATPAPGFVDAIREPPADWAAWMGMVTTDGGARVNTSGGIVHFTGIAWAGEAGQPSSAVSAAPHETAFASGACLAVPRPAWELLGGFAEQYFMYQEDVDLSLRLRLSGGRLGVVPTAIVDHDYTFNKGPMKWRLLERNRWATIVRCYPAQLLLLLSPALAATEVALLAAAAWGGWLPQKLEAAGETVRALPRLLRERRAIQARRGVSSAEFAVWLTPDLDSPFLGRAGRFAPLRWAMRAYWRIVTGVLR